MLRHLIALAALLSSVAPAASSSSGWLPNEGGALRLVTSGLADEDGRLRGALEIRLKPGWGTYWQNPGDSGVPPQLDLSGSAGIEDVELLFPPPERIADEYSVWAGYKSSITLPVILTTATPGTAGLIEGSVFLGVCDEICVPVNTSFSFDAGADPHNSADAITVGAAFAALPEKARDDFEVSRTSHRGEDLLLHVDIPEESAEPTLFLAAPEQLRIAMPRLLEHDGGAAVFAAKILQAPQAAAGPLKLDYTLVSGRQAVAGQIPFQRAGVDRADSP